MKNKIKLISVIALTAIIAFSIAACKSAEEKAAEELKGKWKNADLNMEITFGDKDITWKSGDSIFVKGTYVAKDGLLTITATEPEAMKATSLVFTYTIKSNNLTFTNGDYNGQVFTKQ